MEQLLTIVEVAELTRINICTLRKFVPRREIPFAKIGGALRFRVSDIGATMALSLLRCCKEAFLNKMHSILFYLLTQLGNNLSKSSSYFGTLPK
jgi:excisionase family DNA binding protein